MPRIFLALLLAASFQAHAAGRPDVCQNIEQYEALTESDYSALEATERSRYEQMAEDFEKGPEELRGASKVMEQARAGLKNGWMQRHVAVELSYCYLNGIGVTKNIPKAIQLLLPYEAEVESQAAHVLASIRLFYSGSMAEQTKGYQQLHGEYERGSAYAAGKLGHAYLKGLGTTQDRDKALEMYEYAASSGMTYWQFLLAHAYEKGYLGLPIDLKKKEYWLTLEPKVHVGVYECWVAAYYRDGTYPPSTEEEQKNYALCQEANQQPKPTP